MDFSYLQSIFIVLLFVATTATQSTPTQNVTYTAGQCKPKEVHIAYGDYTTEMVIIWSTNGLCSPAKVSYSLNDVFNLNLAAPGDSRAFEGANGEISYMHKAKLRNLEPSSTYVYKPVSGGISEGPYFFKTAGAMGSNKTQFLVMSDLSSASPAVFPLREEAESGKYDAILHAGNIAKNLSSHSGKTGNRYFQEMEPALRTVPYMVSPGPDEVESGTYLHYSQRFAMPFGEWPISKDRMWYSMDIGNVHLISYCTETFYTDGGQYKDLQYNWLIHDLKEANERRDKVPWIVAFAHRPMYCSYEDPSLQCNQEKSDFRTRLEDILYHYGADIIIQSYGTAYERSYPMFKGVSLAENYTDPLGPIHIMTGGLTPWTMEHNFTDPRPQWCASRYTNKSVMSYGRLHIVDYSHATYEQVDVQTKEVIDSFAIVQNNHGQFSQEDLSENIASKIDENIKEAGGKPGVLNIDEHNVTEEEDTTQNRIKKLLQGDNRNRLIIGVVAGSVVLLVLITVLSVRRCRKRRRTSRRWEQMDINYGKRFYSKAPDRDEENDFEIDMSDGTGSTKQLLTSED